MRFLVRLAITAVALWAAVVLVPGIDYTGEWPALVVLALIFGVVNALVRPVLFLLTCPLVVLTLGLFVLVLNGLMLVVTAAIARSLGIGFTVDGLLPAVLGALVVGVVSALLNVFVGEEVES